MTESSRVLRLRRLFSALFVIILSGAVLFPAAATASVKAAPGVDCAAPDTSDPYNKNNINIAIREAPLPFKVAANYITVDVVITKKNGCAPSANYGVFLNFNEQGKESEESPANCQQEHYNSPETPLGVYRCTGIITEPGVWEFHGTVNKPALRYQTLVQEVTLTKNFTAEMGIVKMSFKSRALQYEVSGKTFEVFLLQSHVLLAGAWMLLAAAMAFLAIPRLRRTLSVLALHTLEVRRGFLVSLLWATFAGTLGTGLYLLATQTAYKAPYSTDSFSKSAWDRITNLPYAQDYFLLLYAKILIFGVMAAASVVLMLEAGRQAQYAQDADSLDRDDDDDMWSHGVHFDEDGHVLVDHDAVGAEGVTATAVQARRRTVGVVGVSQRTLWICLWILVIGAGSIGVCVTGLKYLHELIESTIASTVLGSGG
jgi:hypothetical protein